MDDVKWEREHIGRWRAIWWAIIVDIKVIAIKLGVLMWYDWWLDHVGFTWEFLHEWVEFDNKSAWVCWEVRCWS